MATWRSLPRAAGGNALIHGKGYWEAQTNEKVLEGAARSSTRCRNARRQSGRPPAVILEGLLSTSASSAAIRIYGVDPKVETEFGNTARYLVRGDFFNNEDAPLVLGAKTAKTLNVDLGDRVVLTVTDAHGEMQRALFYVSGVLQAGAASVDDGPAYTTLAAAQKAAGMNGITQIGVLSDEASQDAIKAAVLALNAPNTEVLTWQEAMPDLVGFIKLDAAFGDLYGIIVFIVVVFAVMNTFLMIVMERIRELGLLAALGLKPRQIALLLIYESFLMAVVAIAIGFGLGYLGHFTLKTVGIDMADLYGTDVQMGGVTMVDTVVRSKINITRWVNATLSVLALVMLGAVYPAFKASRMNPSQSMRFFQ
ncbi:MAG: FtsX-like permease family protein [bacterium]